MEYGFFCDKLADAFENFDDVSISVRGENFNAWFDVVCPEMNKEESYATIDFDEGVYKFTSSSNFDIDETENIINFIIDDSINITEITIEK